MTFLTFNKELQNEPENVQCTKRTKKNAKYLGRNLIKIFPKAEK